MLKSFFAVVFTALFTVSAFAAGPSQIWRLEITGGAEDIVEISELELAESAGGVNATDLIRLYSFEESAAAGNASWTITHNLGVQWKLSHVTVTAYAVDVVAPGDYYYDTNTAVLSIRETMAYSEVEFTAGGTAEKPATPTTGDIFRDTDLVQWEQYDGAAWNIITVTETTDPLPVPAVVEPDAIAWVPGSGLPASGGPAKSDVVTVDFLQPVVGIAAVRGISFDTPAVNRPGRAIPPVKGLERRAGSAAFDNNKASWFKSNTAPTIRNPLAIQYTYWVGDPTRYPNIVEYRITARKADTAPRSWRLMYWKEGGWVEADVQAGIVFEDGQTKAFSIQ